MRHPILLSFALLFAGIAASAQNLNPVVEVTNTYEQAATGIDKPDQPIAVPDSLLKFNFDMDYEMRTTPYKGAYEFNPYLVELNPMPRSFGEGTLLVRLGAGYGLHPEADIVWSPIKANNFRLNLYANHHSYFGKYRTMQYPTGGDTQENLLFRGDKDNLYDGADSNTSAGVNTLLNWKSGSWTTDLHYQHLFASDTWTEYHHHVAALQTRVKSAPQNRFYYNLGLRGNYLVRGDNMKGGIISADGGIGSNRRSSQARLDFFGEAIITQELRSAGQIGFIPRFVFRMGNLHFNLGLKVAFILRSQDDFYPSNGGYVFPDVHIDYRVVPEDFILYASATGGNKMQGYAPLLQQNHFLPSFLNDGFDVEVEHVNVAAGARGNIGRRFHYDTKIGYAFYSNAVLWGFDVVQGGYARKSWWYPAVFRENYGLFYADFAGGWKSEHLDMDAHLRYQAASLKGGNYMVFAPAAFVAQAKIQYNWAERIKVGVDLDASTDRLSQLTEEESGPVYGLPGYADLGLYAEYGFTRKFAFWVRGGNLLNMEVQRTPFHAERGIYFTAGLQYRF